VKVYESFAVRLSTDYSAEPSPETQAIITRIRSRAASSAVDAPVPHELATAEPVAPPSRLASPRALWALAAVAVLGVMLQLRPASKPLVPPLTPLVPTTIAVLPFDNLSADKAFAYLAGGLQDEILTELSRVGSIEVISRTSVMRYAAPNLPSIRQIAAEVGAGSILEGSVQVIDRRLRINVQLIDAATDRQLWAERYDRPLDDAFAIQSEVARRIVESVGTMLSDDERERLARPPTRSAEAYQLYLQARDYYARPNRLQSDITIAARLLEQAVSLDSGFALAHAALSMVHEAMYTLRHDPSPQRAARQLAEARVALRLAPDLPQAHLAMGHVYADGVVRNYEAALAEYQRALVGLPNDAGVWGAIGGLLTRMGRWDEAVAAYQRAEQLNPRDPNLFFIGSTLTYLRLHRYAETIRALDRALTLAPDLHSAAFRRAHAFVLWRGELDTMRAVINRIPKHLELFAYGRTEFWHLQLLLWERRGDSLLRVLDDAHVRFFDSYYWFYPASLYVGWAHQLRGDGAAAHAAFDTTRVTLDSLLRQLPEDWRLHAARGLALAGMGYRAEAVREARWLRNSLRYREAGADWATLAEERARILSQAGEPQAALDEIEQMLRRPSLLSVHALRLDPLWDPLRQHPRFQALLIDHGQEDP
jgi:TolB-like protein